VALEQVFFRVLPFSTASIFPPVLPASFHLHAALARRTKSRSP
jgi:hypothetical protein